jgi:hypothetical protein
MKNRSAKDKEVKDGCGGYIVLFAVCALLWFYGGLIMKLFN